MLSEGVFSKSYRLTFSHLSLCAIQRPTAVYRFKKSILVQVSPG